MAFCHKWDGKNDFAYMLQFFSLISDGLGSVLRARQAKYLGAALMGRSRHRLDRGGVLYV